MIQYITDKEFATMNVKQKAWLTVECSKLGKEGTLDDGFPFLTLGDLLEILERNDYFSKDNEYQYHIHVEDDGWHVTSGQSDVHSCYVNRELIYALWFVVLDLCEK